MGRKNNRMHLKGECPKWRGKTLDDITLSDGSRKPVVYEPVIGAKKHSKRRNIRFLTHKKSEF